MNDPNKLRHIFGNPDHNLDSLVRDYGSEQAAARAIREAVNHAYHAGLFILDRFGRYKEVLDVGGYSVTVSGRVVNGVARVGSAWIRPPAAGDDDA